MSNNTNTSLSVMKCRNGLPKHENGFLDEVIAYNYDVMVIDENVDLEIVLENIQSTILTVLADAFGCSERNGSLTSNETTYALNIPDVLSFDPHPYDIADDGRDCVAEDISSDTNKNGICFPIKGFITANICRNCPSVEIDVLLSIKSLMESGHMINNSSDLSGITFLGKMLDEMPHIPAEPTDNGNNSNAASSYYESHDVTALGGLFVAALCSSFLLFWVSIARRRRRQLSEEEQDEDFSDFEEGQFETEMDEY